MNHRDSRRRTRTSNRRPNPEEEDDDFVMSSEGASDVSENMSSGSASPDNIASFIEDDDDSRKRRARKRASRSARVRPRRRLQRPRTRRRSFSSISEPENSFDELQAELAEIRPQEARSQRQRELRQRTNRPDYAIPPPLPEAPEDHSPPRRRDLPAKTSFRGLYPDYASLGLGLPGGGNQTYGNYGPSLGLLQSDSDSSDDDRQAERKSKQTNGVAPGSLAQVNSGPANHGRIKGANLADADPVATGDVDFTSVGGLEEQIDQLKEMVSLPLLYPEIFQKFHVTPPRGVLFHGPPGTGKTLMARALAASCSSEGKKISFYMRKGADCLSKWVGEAERQLRLLFDEAKQNQPSIIFFDEIDGLAPVRSAKQDQIHASIVSTLLALMDGMDSRGQIVIIGATNRPDSVDPALRRPGRFDREFYFPLPALEARKHILNIHTRKWLPPPSSLFVTQLAEQTKGYGGADLRALCTEAALNAVQRIYPQIYASSAKLLIDLSKIDVAPRDFMLAMDKIVPSSARTVVNGAAPLPKHIEPLLTDSLNQIMSKIKVILPKANSSTTLQRNTATGQNIASFEAEAFMKYLGNTRLYRPRLMVLGRSGSGQAHIGAGILHDIEGTHVVTLDLSTLLTDASTSPEAALVHLLQEARRRKPAVIYMPSANVWYDAASQTTRAVFHSIINNFGANEAIMLLAVCEEEAEQIDPELLALFSSTPNNIVHLPALTKEALRSFYQLLAANVAKSPNAFVNIEGRKERIIEELPLAPAAPEKPPSKAEVRLQETKDRKLKLLLRAKLGPLMELLRTRYKRFKRPMIVSTVHYKADQCRTRKTFSTLMRKQTQS